jgi:hypothetical protein
VTVERYQCEKRSYEKIEFTAREENCVEEQSREHRSAGRKDNDTRNHGLAKKWYEV